MTSDLQNLADLAAFEPTGVPVQRQFLAPKDETTISKGLLFHKWEVATWKTIKGKTTLRQGRQNCEDKTSIFHGWEVPVAEKTHDNQAYWSLNYDDENKWLK